MEKCYGGKKHHMGLSVGDVSIVWKVSWRLEWYKKENMQKIKRERDIRLKQNEEREAGKGREKG